MFMCKAMFYYRNTDVFILEIFLVEHLDDPAIFIGPLIDLYAV